MGYPSILMQALYTVYIVALNMILAGFSDAAVTVLGLYYKVQTFFFDDASIFSGDRLRKDQPVIITDSADFLFDSNFLAVF